MSIRLISFCFVFLLAGTVFGGDYSLVYSPEGDAIVITNGVRWKNRPLYCYESFAMVWSGEMPWFMGEMASLYVGFERQGVRVPLHEFSTRIMRARPGRMEWECSDSRFPGLTVTLLGTTLYETQGFTARIKVSGSKEGDLALLCFVPNWPKRDATYEKEITPKSFSLKSVETNSRGDVQAHLSYSVESWQKVIAKDPPDFGSAAPLPDGQLKNLALLASVPVSDDRPVSLAVGYESSFKSKPDAGVDAAKVFEAGYGRAEEFNARLAVDTPDPYLNAGAPFSVSASSGLFADPTFLHGGSVWRMRMPGWRTMGGSIYYGWLDRIKRAVKHYTSRQIKEAPENTGPVYSEDGCRQVGKSRFHGKGFIQYEIPSYYEFQTQFFDHSIRAWRASADPELEKMLLPALELHLERCKECFDPDNDWTYESYNNTWPNDSIWFNGGGTPEQTAYVYYAHRAAAEMNQRAGNADRAAEHQAIALKIKQALNKLLWMPESGHFASYVEPWGKRRQMPDAWIYAQQIPIEAGLATPEQSWKAMYYTEWAMECFILPFGEMRQSSNFVPGQWSIRELYHGDNFGMALAYFLSGQGDEGWNLMRGAMIESMYGDGVPKSGYSRESGQFNLTNYISPGGFSHPNCAIDFIDIISPFSRALVEGLFGYRPDYPNNLVRMEPTFPSSWDHASISTPDFSLEFKDNSYKLSLSRPARIKFGVPVRAARVKSVTLNGQPVDFRIEPWAGYGMLRVETPELGEALLKVETEGESKIQPVLVEEKEGGKPGYELVLNKIDGAVPRYQLTKVHVPKKKDPRVLRKTVSVESWRHIDISSKYNCDLREIFQQRYDSPRPDRSSMRIAYNGWSSWTFALWRINPPNIRMNNVLDLKGKSDLIKDNYLLTPQGARFLRPTLGKNIAFTSTWDNWPESVTVPVNSKGKSIWLLVSGSTTPMQGKIANAVFRFHYEDGKEERLELIPPKNYWSLCKFGNVDYNYDRDGFSFAKEPPSMVQLGENCRAMVYGWKLRQGVKLEKVTLETLSLDVVVGLMGVSVANPEP